MSRKDRWLAAATLGVLIGLMPIAVEAHVKWFEDPSKYPLRTDLIVSSRTTLLVAVCVGAILVLAFLQRVLGDPYWPELGIFKRMAIGAPTLLAVQAGIGLVHAAVGPSLFAPNLPLHRDAIGLGLATVEVLIAFSFITGILDWLGAAALVLLVAPGMLLFPPVDLLDQFFWVGIAVVILVIGRVAVEAGQPRPWFERRSRAWSPRAVALLRVTAGIGIIVSALSEKIWDPAIGEAFLAHHPQFNFMHTYLGINWFTDSRFVLAAGIAEAVIGVLLASGLLTRMVIVGMWLPFNITVPFLPPQELLGHLPIFGIMYFLLVHGAGLAPGESLDKDALPGSPRAHPGAGAARARS
ncbi:MAG: hypothetical protein ACR2MQ_05245 [Gemmatimonadaceae bacterium]